MKKIILISIFLLLPFSIFAFELWDENINQEILYIDYATIFSLENIKLLGIQILSYWTYEAGIESPEITFLCDEKTIPFPVVQSFTSPDWHFSGGGASTSGNLIYFNRNCDSFSLGQVPAEDDWLQISIFYIQYPKTLKTELIQNPTTEAEFYLDKIISYGDILVVIFLSIFMIFIICKAIAGFIFKQWN